MQYERALRRSEWQWDDEVARWWANRHRTPVNITAKDVKPL